MRITIIAIGSRGDVQPYVALGAGLRRAGHHVRLATHPRFSGLMAGSSLEFSPIAEGALSRGQATAAGRSWIRWGGRLLPYWVGLFRDAASVARQRLIDVSAATEDADVVLVSPLGTLLGWQLAQVRDLPLVRAYYVPPAAVMAHGTARQALWLCARPWVNRARAAALGLPRLSLKEPFGDLDAEHLPVLYGFSPAVVPPPAAGNSIEVTGYWTLPAPGDWTPPAVLSSFLAAGEPPVVVAFGSLGDRHPGRTTAILLDAIASSGHRAIIIRGPHLEPGAALPSDVLALDPLPHDWLFPRATAVVHHGGAGTTFYALRAGVPSVVVPVFGDQSFWARQVHALGVGAAPIPRKRLSVERLASAIQLVTTDAAMRERAATLGRRLVLEDGVSTAVASFERQMARWRAQSPSDPDQQEIICSSAPSSLA